MIFHVIHFLFNQGLCLPCSTDIRGPKASGIWQLGCSGVAIARTQRQPGTSTAPGPWCGPRARGKDGGRLGRRTPIESPRPSRSLTRHHATHEDDQAVTPVGHCGSALARRQRTDAPPKPRCTGSRAGTDFRQHLGYTTAFAIPPRGSRGSRHERPALVLRQL